MKKVTSEQLVVGKTYYAHDDQTTQLTFVKYDENGCPCFTQPKGGYWREQTDGLCHFGGNPIFYEISALTLQEKFEQGWEMKNKHVLCIVTDLRVMKNNYVAVVYDTDSSDMFYSEDNFLSYHTITPPAPKVQRRFTGMRCEPVYGGKIGFYSNKDCETLEEAKEDVKTYKRDDVYHTTILEHEKVEGKWKFVKAHEV